MPVLLRITSIFILQVGGALGSGCPAGTDGSTSCASIQDISSPSSAVLMQREHQIHLPKQSELHAVPAAGHSAIQFPQVPEFRLVATDPAQQVAMQAPLDSTGISAQAPLATSGTSAQAPLTQSSDAGVSTADSTFNNQVVSTNLPADGAGTVMADAPLPQQQTGVVAGTMPLSSEGNMSVTSAAMPPQQTEEKPRATTLTKKASKAKEKKETKKEDEEDPNSWSAWLMGSSSSDKSGSDKSASDKSGNEKKQASSKSQEKKANAMPKTDYEDNNVGVAPGTAVSPSSNDLSSSYSGAADTGATATTAQTMQTPVSVQSPAVSTVVTPVANSATASAPRIVQASPTNQVVGQAVPVVSNQGAMKVVAPAPVAGTRKVLVPVSSDKQHSTGSQTVGVTNQKPTGSSTVVSRGSTNGTTGAVRKIVTASGALNSTGSSLKTTSSKKNTTDSGAKVPESLGVDNIDFIDDQMKKAKQVKAKKAKKRKHSLDNDDDEDEDEDEFEDEDEEEEDLSGKQKFESAYEDKEVPLSNLGYKKILKLNDDGELRHFVGRVVNSMGLAADSSKTLSDVANMRSGSSFSGLVSDVLKSKLKGSITSTVLKKSGRIAPVSENGYRGVVQMHSDKEMSYFMKRVAEGMGLQVLSNGPLQGAAQFYSGTEGIQSLDDLEEELKLACNREDTWVRKVGVVRAKEDAPSVAADAPIAAAASEAGLATYAQPPVLPPLDQTAAPLAPGTDSLAAQAAVVAPIVPAAEPVAPAADPYATPTEAPAVAPVAPDPAVNAVAAPATAAANPIAPPAEAPAPAPAYNADVAMALAPAGAAPVGPAVAPEAAGVAAPASLAPNPALASQPAATAASPAAAANPAADADTAVVTPGPGILDNLQ